MVVADGAVPKRESMAALVDCSCPAGVLIVKVYRTLAAWQTTPTWAGETAKWSMAVSFAAARALYCSKAAASPQVSAAAVTENRTGVVASEVVGPKVAGASLGAAVVGPAVVGASVTGALEGLTVVGASVVGASVVGDSAWPSQP